MVNCGGVPPPRDRARMVIRCALKRKSVMYHYDPATALEELSEEAVLPNPVKLRDMMLRAHLDADHSLEYNRLFVEYQRQFGELQRLGKQLLEGLAANEATRDRKSVVEGKSV